MPRSGPTTALRADRRGRPAPSPARAGSRRAAQARSTSPGRISARSRGLPDGPADPTAGRLVALPAFTDAHDHGRGTRTIAFGAADDALEVWIARLGQEPKVDPYLRAGCVRAGGRRAGIGAANHRHNTQDPDALMAEAEGR